VVETANFMGVFFVVAGGREKSPLMYDPNGKNGPYPVMEKKLHSTEVKGTTVAPLQGEFTA